MTKFDEEKKRLLLGLKQGTLAQLAAIKAKDSEQFLQSTDLCNKYIVSYNALKIHIGETLEVFSNEIRDILLEISEIREEISSLIPPLYEKLKEKSAVEKKLNFARHRYKRGDLPLPNVFMDTKI